MAVAVKDEKKKDMAAAPIAPVKKGRGLSFEEKRKRLNDFLLEKKDFFQLKELEKMVPKATGIISQSVKEVVQSLVDDRLVNCEKIGTSNYFWSFPSTAMQLRANSKRNLEEEVQKFRDQKGKLEVELMEAERTREDTEERTELLNKYGELVGRKEGLEGKLQMYRANDPVLLAAKRAESQEAKQAVNRWTDNLFTLQSYCGRNFGIERGAFWEQFGIDEEPDYI